MARTPRHSRTLRRPASLRTDENERRQHALHAKRNVRRNHDTVRNFLARGDEPLLRCVQRIAQGTQRGPATVAARVVKDAGEARSPPAKSSPRLWLCAKLARWCVETKGGWSSVRSPHSF